MRFTLFVLLVSSAVLLPPTVTAQETTVDTTRIYELDAIVKIADREETVAMKTTSAVSVIGSQAIRRTPAQTLSDLLAFTPGIAFFRLDGMGYAAQPVVRGFYGGGEAEYVLLQIDGEPVGDLESGLVDWQILPIGELAAVEIGRGGSSPLYGDAAIGAVIDLKQGWQDRKGGSVSIGSGGFAPLRLDFQYGGRLSNVAGPKYSVFAGYERVDGYRRHAERDLGSAGGRLQLVDRRDTELAVSTVHHWNRADLPGPLTGSLSDESPRASLPFFRYDRSDESIHRLRVHGRRRIRSGLDLSFSASGQLRNLDATESVPLSAEFADTQRRDLRDIHLLANAQVTASTGIPGRVVAGVDVSSGWLDTAYYRLIFGSSDDYEAAPASLSGELASEGDGSRSQLAAYAHYDVEIVSPVRFTTGARLDYIHDSFTPRSPDASPDASATSAGHLAFSPKVGLNIRYMNRRASIGHVYANVSRSFKAPTFDQLYDQRAIPVPFPPFQISLSSDQLEPQFGTSVEAGVYHRIEAERAQLSAEFSGAIYRIDMTDEVDFDLQLLQYRNIGKSRHDGIESALKVYWKNTLGAFLSYAYQETTLRFGSFNGNFVKAIPRDVLSGGVSANVDRLSASLTWRAARRIFLDDANTVTLPNYSQIDARVSYDQGRLQVTADIFNVFDKQFNSTGFPDPGGSEVLFLYPSAERYARLSATVNIP